MEAVEDVHTRHRVVTEFMTREGYSPKETHWCLRSMCGEYAKDINSVRCWVHHFNRWKEQWQQATQWPISHSSDNGDHRQGWCNDSEWLLHHGMWTAGRSKGLENQQLWISSEKLATEKSMQNWCWKLLPSTNHPNETYAQNFSCAMRKTAFLLRIITGNKTWVHHYHPLTKRQATEWQHQSLPCCRLLQVKSWLWSFGTVKDTC